MKMCKEKQEENRVKKIGAKLYEVCKEYLLSSIYHMAICVTCLVSLTWAWFSDSITSTGNSLKNATYGVEISVSGNESKGYEIVSGDGVWLENGERYDIRIEATGDASRGFCIVSAGDIIYHTDSMIPRDMLEFSLFFAGTGFRYVEFLPNWGLYRDTISAGDVILPGASISAGDAVLGGDAKESRMEVSSDVISAGDSVS